MIVYIKLFLKINKENFLGLITDYIKVIGDKVNIKQSIIFLHTSKEQLESEINSTIPLTSDQKPNLSINLN